MGGIADGLLYASQMIKTMITRAMASMLALDYFISDFCRLTIDTAVNRWAWSPIRYSTRY